MVSSVKVRRLVLAGLRKRGFKDVVVRGSAAGNGQLTPWWSDVDVTVWVPKADVETMRLLHAAKDEYELQCPEIALSLTVIDAGDTVQSNYFHHHGEKPLSYSWAFTKVPFRHAPEDIRASCVCNYYKILYTFRREMLNGPVTAKAVARGFHRLAYFIKQQEEILHPEIVFKGEGLDGTSLKGLVPKRVVQEFFRKYARVKRSWQSIRGRQQVLERLAGYLIDGFDDVHQAFLPKLKEVGVQRAYHC